MMNDLEGIANTILFLGLSKRTFEDKDCKWTYRKGKDWNSLKQVVKEAMQFKNTGAKVENEISSIMSKIDKVIKRKGEINNE